ncbi:class I SAM-dependent methyltransferase [Flagellimonas sp.]|uniref:class I SAM-dependent methyltransferase n=1 Tax=Flagellimonas sp. TaxID=2058762 RepID=UPI003F4A5572
MKLYLKTKDYSFSKQEFDLMWDESKDMLITHPVPENLETFYEGDNYISHTDSNKSFVDLLYQRIKAMNLSNKLQLIENQGYKNKNILDIGAGTGDFLNLARTKGFKVSGVEPSDKARDKAKQKGIDLEHNLNHISSSKYDVITLWHVLEHLPDLKNQIEKISYLLDEDGILVVAVPNFRSWDAKHYGKFWAAYDVPRHLWHFSKRSIELLFKEQQMKIKTIMPMRFDAFYVSLLSEKYKRNPFYLLSAFFKGLWSNVDAIRTKEYSSLIYVLEKEKT